MHPVNQGRDIAGHADGEVIFFFQQLRLLIHQIGGKQPVEAALRIGLIEFIHPAREEAEGREEEHAAPPPPLLF